MFGPLWDSPMETNTIMDAFLNAASHPIILSYYQAFEYTDTALDIWPLVIKLLLRNFQKRLK